METAHRNDRSQGLHNIYYNLCLIKNERLSANIKLTLHKALIRSVMTYAWLAWELATDTHLLKLQRL
jgi:hypothetical protein